MPNFLISSSSWLTIVLAFVIAFPVALNNLLLALFLLVALPLYGGKAWETIKNNAVVRPAIMLFALLLLGVAYGATPFGDAVGMLGKYADLAVIPLLVLALREEKTRRRSLLAFLASMVLIAVVSWLIGLHVIPYNEWVIKNLVSSTSTPENPSVFHSHITQGMLMAYAAYLFALYLRDATDLRRRILFSGLILLTAGNVLLMIKGRTGYVVLLALLAWMGWIWLKARLVRQGKALTWRHGVIAILLPAILSVAAYLLVPRIHERVQESVAEYQVWKPHAHKEPNSIGDRLEFYYNSFAIVMRHPFAGVGTGGFEVAYEQQVRGMGIAVTNNPHNEYLLITIQVGVFGFVLLLYLFYSQWRNAANLPTSFEQDAARGLVITIALSCLFNSNLRDHVPGMFFAFMSALLFANLGSGMRHG